MDGMESTAVAAVQASQMDTMQWEGILIMKHLI